LEGVLCSIEFIYISSGVNRPLKPSDNPDKNLNKTYYRDQINKVANAVKLLLVSKDAYKGIFLVEDLSLIYVMVRKYDDAIVQIKYLLSIPGLLSTKILELDPRWAPLRNQPEFKKMMESYSGK
jgi:hypothetical protein